MVQLLDASQIYNPFVHIEHAVCLGGALEALHLR